MTDLKDNTSEFDSVIVTIPTPQLLNLKGSIQDFLASQRPLLDAVQYSSRYAVAMYFEQGVKIDVPWCSKYVTGSPCVRFLSVDSRKRFGKGKWVLTLEKVLNDVIFEKPRSLLEDVKF